MLKGCPAEEEEEEDGEVDGESMSVVNDGIAGFLRGKISSVLIFCLVMTKA